MFRVSDKKALRNVRSIICFVSRFYYPGVNITKLDSKCLWTYYAARLGDSKCQIEL